MVFSVIGPGIVGATFVAIFVNYMGKRWFFYIIFALVATIAGMLISAANKKPNIVAVEEQKAPARRESSVESPQPETQKPGKGK